MIGTREAARVDDPGTFPMPGLAGAQYVIGREPVADVTADLMREGDRCGVLAVDTETGGKEGRKRYDLRVVSIGHSDLSVIYDPRDPVQRELVIKVLNSGGYMLAYHNSSFDVPILHMNELLTLENVWRTVDTLLWARLAEPGKTVRKDLHNAVNRYLDLKMTDPLADICKALGISKDVWYATKDIDVPAYRIMAASDVILTHRLIPEVKAAALRRLTEGHPFTQYGVKGDEALRLVDREQIINRQHLERTCLGFKVDPVYLDHYRDTTAARLRTMGEELGSFGVDPGNANHLTTYLNDQGLLPANYPWTAGGKNVKPRPSGTKTNLESLNHPLAATFIEHKEITHVLRDYLDKVLDAADEDMRIHPGTNILSATTGRASMSGDAPLHQFPGPARGIILADNWEEARRNMEHDVLDKNGDAIPCTCKNPKGLVSIDWSQIEAVLAANMAQDHHFIEAYEAGTTDVHSLISQLTGVPRKDAKSVVFAQLYGEGITKLANDLKVTQDEARKIIETIWRVLPGTRKLVDKSYRGGKLQTIAEKYRLIFTLSGRILPIGAGRWPCWQDHETEAQILACRKCDRDGTIFRVEAHKGVNYFVQGSAYDLLAEAEVEIIKQGLGGAIYFGMHDELVVDADAAHDIRRIMETPPARLIELAKRTPVLRTDMAHTGERWVAA